LLSSFDPTGPCVYKLEDEVNLKPEELESSGFRLLDELPHAELIPFVQRAMALPTFWARAYWFLIVVGGVSLLALIPLGPLPWGLGLSRLGLGLALAFLLVPLHEGMHALAYRWVGAKQTSFDAVWRKFYFMALAHRFVADERAFRLVALMPFGAITGLGLVASLWLPTQWAYVLWGLVFAHASFCSGDFALLSYFESRRPLEVVTYDDADRKISYFYGR